MNNAKVKVYRDACMELLFVLLFLRSTGHLYTRAINILKKVPVYFIDSTLDRFLNGENKWSMGSWILMDTPNHSTTGSALNGRALKKKVSVALSRTTVPA